MVVTIEPVRSRQRVNVRVRDRRRDHHHPGVEPGQLTGPAPIGAKAVSTGGRRFEVERAVPRRRALVLIGGAERYRTAENAGNAEIGRGVVDLGVQQDLEVRLRDEAKAP